jgi:hypothetical protein
MQSLLAAKPRRQIALGLGGVLLYLAVKLVNLFERVGLGALCVGLGVALGLRDVLVDICDLSCVLDACI